MTSIPTSYELIYAAEALLNPRALHQIDQPNNRYWVPITAAAVNLGLSGLDRATLFSIIGECEADARLKTAAVIQRFGGPTPRALVVPRPMAPVSADKSANTAKLLAALAGLNLGG